MKRTMRIAKYPLILILAVILAGCGVSKKEHESLQSKYVKIQGEMSAFNKQVGAIEDENRILKQKTKELKTQIRAKKSENDTLKTAYQRVSNENKDLQSQLLTAERQTIQPAQ